MNETEFLAKAAPASNHYKINNSLTTGRSPKANMNRDKSPKAPMIPYKKEEPSAAKLLNISIKCNGTSLIVFADTQYDVK